MLQDKGTELASTDIQTNITNQWSLGGNAIASFVRPFVSTLSSGPTDR